MKLYPVRVTCPYCGFENELRLEEGSRVVDCYPEDGGCDRKFVATVKVSTSTRIFQIEGQAELESQRVDELEDPNVAYLQRRGGGGECIP